MECPYCGDEETGKTREGDATRCNACNRTWTFYECANPKTCQHPLHKMSIEEFKASLVREVLKGD